MRRVLRLLAVLTVATGRITAEEVVKVSARDSYLDAYRETHSAATSKPVRKSDNFPGGPYGPPVQSHFGQYPGAQYGPPQSSQYGPPQSSQYGPPYGGGYPEPAPQSYGPPAPVYGAPAQNLQVFYGVPHAMISLWDKLWEKIKWKLDVLTVGKIILKLVIFKKIVSFIAILMLLLFLPAFKKKKGFFAEEHEGEARSWSGGTANDALDNLTSFVIGAIENYGSKDRVLTCDNSFCRSARLMKRIEDNISYTKLARLYAKEVQ